MNAVLLSLYFLSLLGLVIFGAHRYTLIYYYKKHKNTKPKAVPLSEPYPMVTVQLPIYNEINVVARIIESVAKMDYPKDRMEIQLLDDSTDETEKLTSTIVEKYKKDGFNISYVHRNNRDGYKAGALQNGLITAKGEFVAIFDADFIPQPDFLKKLMPYFSQSDIGMVQARWGYTNRKHSLLTEVQAVILDGHFLIEHTARNRSGRFFNFNGTAGIWRKKTIAAAGGWHGDTLTEDMDLSYRAQLNGWKFVFVPDVVTPSELPVDVNAFKIQQGRWAKGTIQVAKKLSSNILKSDIPLKIKIEALFHLSSNLCYIFLMIVALVLLPAILVRMNFGRRDLLLFDLPIFITGTLSIAYFYYTSQRELGYNIWDSIKYIPFLMSAGIGLAINNSKFVLEGIYGQKSEFVRTPKTGNTANSQKFYKSKKSIIVYAEFLMAVYFTVLLYLAISAHLYLTVPIILLFQAGFAYFALISLAQSFARK